MSMQGSFMDESVLPSPKGRHNLLKDGFITLFPNMPASKNDHFSEERLIKTPHGL
jgi:hypothetical protein